MKSSYKRLGDYIRPVDVRNHDLGTQLLRGISTSKKLIESVANVSGVDFSGYKIVENGQFVYVADTSRRGEKIAVAMSEEERCIVSSIYTVFEVIDENVLLPEFILMWFKRPEFDRYSRFHSWGSARETFNWEDMCEIRIPIPNIEEQRRFVALYNGIMKNQKAYEMTLKDLQLICDSYMDALIGNVDSKPLGDYIQPIDERNYDLELSNVRGLSTAKMFIESVANLNGVSLSGYKKVRNGKFAYVADTSRRGEKIALALNEGADCIVSSIYTVFEVKAGVELMPEFLFLWFKRPEFDRYARFHSWGSARETFDWSDMCDVQIPVPEMSVQKSIVAIHHVLESRKRIDARLRNLVKPLCPILFRGVVESMA
jgi:type I restriction enzyme S subunit